MAEYTNGFDWIPEDDIVEDFHNLLSTSDILKTRLIDGNLLETTFERDKDLNDLALLEVQYNTPIVCTKLGTRVDDEIISHSDEIIIRTFVVIDSSVAAATKLDAEIGSSRLQRNIKQVLYNNRYNGNMVMKAVKSFLTNPYQHNSLFEVTWRTFVEVEYR